MARAKGKQRPKAVQAASKDEASAEKHTIVFIHPDLGIGGAERLVVDAAVGLQERGHKVVIFTNHCDPNHCFDECRDGTLDVRVRASGPIPMSIFNRFTILCAIARQLQLLCQVTFTRELTNLKPGAFIIDQLSAGLPLLQYLCPSGPMLFYCHFPDMLLAQGRGSALKRLYRLPFDWLEEWSMSYAHAIAVNSGFTKGVVGDTWPRLKTKLPMRVVNPCVETGAKDTESRKGQAKSFGGDKIILSINRFERKKDIALAIKAFAAIPAENRKSVRLAIAGGYDHRIDENVQHLKELQSLADSLSIPHQTIASTESLSSAEADSQIIFLPSVPGATKTQLLQDARLLVYTPAQEHFGIVPLEAMLARTPVLAATTGGPVETVVDGQTGWLRPTTDTPAWTEVMVQALRLSEKQAAVLGEAGAKRVSEIFGREHMAKSLEDIVTEMRSTPPPRRVLIRFLANMTILTVAFLIGILASQIYPVVKDRYWPN